MKKSSWHVRFYHFTLGFYPDTYCHYIGNWIAIVFMYLLLIPLLVASIVYAIYAYFKGWYMLFSGKMFGNLLQADNTIRIVFLLINVLLLVFLYASNIGNSVKCKKITWDEDTKET